MIRNKFKFAGELLFLFKYSWKSVTWAFVIIILSTIDPGNMPRTPFLNIPYFDKFVHFGLYMVFSFLIIDDLKRSGFTGNSRMVIFISAIGAASVFGGGMELLQLIPGLHRSAEAADFFVNILGSVSAVILFRPANRLIGIILHTGK